MPLDERDVGKLQSWSFLSDYRKRRRELIVLARAAYAATEYLLEDVPTPDECEELYTMMLLGTDIFKGMVARKRHLRPSLYESMCLALAKYVLHTDWGEILPI